MPDPQDNIILDDFDEEPLQHRHPLFNIYRMIVAILLGSVFQAALVIFVNEFDNRQILVSFAGGMKPFYFFDLFFIAIILSGAWAYCYFAGAKRPILWLFAGGIAVVFLSHLFYYLYFVELMKGEWRTTPWLKACIGRASLIGLYMSMICFVKSFRLWGVALLALGVILWCYLQLFFF